MRLKDFAGKKVLIMGLGLNGGGVESARFFYQNKAKVTITDLQQASILQPSIQGLSDCPGIVYHLGSHQDKDFVDADIVVKNPGVPPDSSYLKTARQNGSIITSDLEVFLNLARPKQIIAITGTKGKSTTATFISQILNCLEIDNILAGNIGRSPLNSLGVENQKIVVIELSSFQIDDLGEQNEYFDTVVFTNIFPDHLNRYKTFENYRQSKLRLIKYLKPKGNIIYPSNNFSLPTLTSDLTAIPFSDKYKPKLTISSPQNHLNANAALLAVSRTIKISPSDIISKLGKLDPPRFRNQTVRTLGGVSFINDSTATNPTVAVSTLSNYPAKKSVVILGGSDKNLSVDVLINFINSHKFPTVLLDTPVGKQIQKFIDKNLVVSKTSDFENAVRSAYDYLKTTGGSYLILSPGAASFGMFLNEFDRGEQFNRIVAQFQ